MNLKHGHRKGGRHTRTYNSWRAMLQRCENPNHWMHEHYQSSGIRVCKRWHDFGKFLKDMGDRPEGMTLDRIKNDRGYTPGNCRWATPAQQVANRRAPWGREEPPF